MKRGLRPACAGTFVCIGSTTGAAATAGGATGATATDAGASTGVTGLTGSGGSVIGLAIGDGGASPPGPPPAMNGPLGSTLAVMNVLVLPRRTCWCSTTYFIATGAGSGFAAGAGTADGVACATGRTGDATGCTSPTSDCGSGMICSETGCIGMRCKSMGCAGMGCSKAGTSVACAIAFDACASTLRCEGVGFGGSDGASGVSLCGVTGMLSISLLATTLSRDGRRPNLSAILGALSIAILKSAFNDARMPLMESA